MNITIKNMGHNHGTSGWLKEEIEAGRMNIVEGITKEGNIGLWAKHITPERKKSMCLALYNPYGMDGKDYEMCSPMHNSCPGDPGAVENVFGLTPAALRSVLNIARAWCNKKNEERENDLELKFEIKFV